MSWHMWRQWHDLGPMFIMCMDLAMNIIRKIRILDTINFKFCQEKTNRNYKSYNALQWSECVKSFDSYLPDLPAIQLIKGWGFNKVSSNCNFGKKETNRNLFSVSLPDMPARKSIKVEAFMRKVRLTITCKSTNPIRYFSTSLCYFWLTKVKVKSSKRSATYTWQKYGSNLWVRLPLLNFSFLFLIDKSESEIKKNLATLSVIYFKYDILGKCRVYLFSNLFHVYHMLTASHRWSTCEKLE